MTLRIPLGLNYSACIYGIFFQAKPDGAAPATLCSFAGAFCTARRKPVTITTAYIPNLAMTEQESTPHEAAADPVDQSYPERFQAL